MNEKTQAHIEHYEGSLDFPCDLCDSNSYDNYHFHSKGRIVFVACVPCLKKNKIEVADK